jgi:hypothetical protein
VLNKAIFGICTHYFETTTRLSEQNVRPRTVLFRRAEPIKLSGKKHV